MQVNLAAEPLHVLVSSKSIGACSRPARAGGWSRGGDSRTPRQTPPCTSLHTGRRLSALQVSLFGPLWVGYGALKCCSDIFPGYQYVGCLVSKCNIHGRGGCDKLCRKRGFSLSNCACLEYRLLGSLASEMHLQAARFTDRWKESLHAPGTPD